ncbi:hypothetical protein ACQ4PT_004926 [Festuca glaucescens]
MCRIKVSGGVLSIENIVERLRWLVDDNFPWDVQPQGDNVYKTQFTNKLELVRATRFGSCKVKDIGCSIEFTEWKSAVQPIAKLDEVWILTSGVPDGMIRNYLTLWGLDEGYKLTFEVEEDFIPVDEDEDMLNAQDGNDDKEDESRNAEQSKDKNSNNKRSEMVIATRVSTLGDKIHGFGVYSFVNGHCYAGSWHEGKNQGLGYTFQNGDKRSGDWDFRTLKIPMSQD